MSKVVFMMTDGLRPDAITPENAPNLIDFMARGSYTRKAQSLMPTVTLPCHTSIFHSVPSTRHGILDNEWKSMARPVTGLVEQISANNKKAGFIHNWERLRDLNRPEQLYFSFYINTSYDADGDKYVADTAIEWIPKSECDFWFVYFGTVDTSGHKYGWMEEGYINQIKYVDNLIGDVLSVIDDETTVIIHSDHGGHDRTHGTDSPEDMNIPYMITGPNIKKNHELQSEVTLLDTTPTIAHILGISPNLEWEGNIISEAFES
jgi:predicted AlkP superfamily pyrophosphatase or phosphodiesterase